MSRSGFTLIEVLAVVVLLGLTAVTLAPSLGPTRELFEARAIREQLRDLDARARLLARTSGPVALAVTHGGHRVLLLETPSGRTVEQVDLGRDRELRLYAPESVSSIPFTSAGCSPDYQVVLREGREKDAWKVSGESGWVIEREKR